MSVPVRTGPPRRRARNFDFTGYAPRTLATYRRYSDQYEEHAKACGFNARYPTPEQMREFVLTSQTGDSWVRNKQFTALGAFFRMNGAPNVMEHPLVLETIEELRSKSNDPRDLRAGHFRRRAQWYAYEAYSEAVLKAYGQIERRWIAFADAKGFDPHHPRNDQIITYLDLRAENRAYRTVANEANGLRAFFRRKGLPDPIDEEQVLAHLDELRRECKPPKPRAPVYADALIPGLGHLDQDAPVDARDALIVLVAALGGIAGAHAQALDRSRITEVDDGVLFCTDIPRRREIFIGKPAAEELDIRPWLRRWLKHVGTDPGPLFPHITPRGKICDYPITVQTMKQAIKRVARHCGPTIAKFIGLQLKKGFLVKVTRKFGAAAAIQAVGYASERSLERHAPFLGSTYRRRTIADKHRKRRWSAPPMGRLPLASTGRSETGETTDA